MSLAVFFDYLCGVALKKGGNFFVVNEEQANILAKKICEWNPSRLRYVDPAVKAAAVAYGYKVDAKGNVVNTNYEAKVVR